MKNRNDQTSSDLRYYIRVRPGDSLAHFLKRTIAAQLHLLASIFWIFALLILARQTAQYTIWHYVTAMCFGLCSILLFASSALQHFLDDGFHISKKILVLFENLDKIAIYLLIASTYTAVMYNALGEPTRTYILVLVWSLALLGCLYTVFIERLPRWAQSRFIVTGNYLLLGWTSLLCIDELLQNMTDVQFRTVLLGGGFYSVGAASFAFKWPNPTKHFGYHEIWHSAVILGSVMFYLLVMSFYTH